MQEPTAESSCMGHSSRKEEVTQGNQINRDENVNEISRDMDAVNAQVKQTSKNNTPPSEKSKNTTGHINTTGRKRFIQKLIILLLIGLIAVNAFIHYKLNNLDQTQCSCSCGFQKNGTLYGMLGEFSTRV